jgi:hypothetical protein
MSLNRGQLHTHIHDGGVYCLTETSALLKHPDTGEWIASVVYEDADPHSLRFGQVYATTEARWAEKFRVVEGTE